MAENNNEASMQDMQPATAGYYVAKKHLPCPFDDCDRTFTCQHNIRQHIREKHTNERPYECQLCAEAGDFAAFTRPASLYRHQRTMHNYEPNIGNRGRPRGPRRKKGVGRNDAPKPAFQSPNNHRRTSKDATHIDPRLLLQAAQTQAIETNPCWLCGTPVANDAYSMVIHGHIAHNDAYMDTCRCPLCIERFPETQEQQPVATKIVQANGVRDLNDSLRNQPLTTKQPPVIQQPTPVRSLDFSTLKTLDERLKRVQAAQIPDADDTDEILGMESSGGAETLQGKAAVDRPDSGIGLNPTFQLGDINDYAAPLDLSANFDDFLNIPGDDNDAGDSMSD